MLITSQSRLKTEPTRLGKGLTIYKQPKAAGRGSPYWYARANIEVGGRKLHAKSMKTSDFKLASDRAQDFYAELLIQRQGGIVPHGKLSDRAFRFDIVADAWLDDMQRSAGDDRQKVRRYRDHRKIVTAPNGLVAFFGRRDIRTITTKLIGDYLEAAERGSKAGVFRPTTKRNHLSTLSKLLNGAVDLGRLDRRPRLPTIRMRDNPRPPFDAAEYQLLLAACKVTVLLRRGCGDVEGADRWEELLDFIIFLFASFIRPSEWADLKQKHVEVVVNRNGTFLKIRVVGGKNGVRNAVTMPGAVEAYKRIVQRWGADPERYLFMPNYPNRNTAKERMGDRFNELLELTGLALDVEGRKRTLYSLRHTALMLRVLEGDNVDLLALARNAGTSLKMLERFYCSRLEPERKIANLQSFKVPPEPLKPGRTLSLNIEKFAEASPLVAN